MSGLVWVAIPDAVAESPAVTVAQTMPQLTRSAPVSS